LKQQQGWLILISFLKKNPYFEQEVSQFWGGYKHQAFDSLSWATANGTVRF
jgi:hypothetical protein